MKSRSTVPWEKMRGAAPVTNSRASAPEKLITCKPSGRPSTESRGSDKVGTPMSEPGTLKTGLPVERAQAAAALAWRFI
jgi:hypothetical protein